MSMDDGELSSSRPRRSPQLERATGPAPLSITAEPWFPELMDEAIDRLGGDEFMVFLIWRHDPQRGRVVVVEHLIPEQRVSRASCSVTARAMEAIATQFARRVTELGGDPGDYYLGWAHTHPSFSASPSIVDHEYSSVLARLADAVPLDAPPIELPVRRNPAGVYVELGSGNRLGLVPGGPPPARAMLTRGAVQVLPSIIRSGIHPREFNAQLYLRYPAVCRVCGSSPRIRIHEDLPVTVDPDGRHLTVEDRAAFVTQLAERVTCTRSGWSRWSASDEEEVGLAIEPIVESEPVGRRDTAARLERLRRRAAVLARTIAELELCLDCERRDGVPATSNATAGPA